MQIRVDNKPGVVILVGAPCSGKSTFAERTFLENQIVSYDSVCRMIGDGEVECESHTKYLMHLLIDMRCDKKRLTCVDATNSSAHERQVIEEMAIFHDLPVYVVALDIPLRVLLERNEERNNPHSELVIVAAAYKQGKALADIPNEGYDRYMIQTLDDQEEVSRYIW